MLSVGEDVEASALSRRGWSGSAIARLLDRDRKTVRSYLAGDRVPGVRRLAGPDSLARSRCTWRPGSLMTRTYGHGRCSTRSFPSVTTGRT